MVCVCDVCGRVAHSSVEGLVEGVSAKVKSIAPLGVVCFSHGMNFFLLEQQTG